jgi:hypothetical protein|tara:strand:- start:2691 stop:2996 length:306 start_codon:yes stop_codon:yes gene_type:complete
MSKYDEYAMVRNFPPKLKVEGKPRQIKIDLISSMCDNRYRWSVSKNDDGDYKISTCGFAYSNFGIKHRKDDIEWAMDDGDWSRAFDMINSGYQAIENLKYR